jgi:hypothetical protein
LALAIVGCRDDGAPADPMGSSSTTLGAETTAAIESSSTSSSSSGAIGDGPPEILDIGGTVVTLAEGEVTTLTAFVQHPRGDEAVVSGALVGAEGPGSYGAFVRGIGGRWSIDVGWDDVAAHEDLYFDGETTIELVARFVDDAGLVGEASYGLPLRCIPLAPNSCDGKCTDFDSSENNCGECGKTCMEQPAVGLSSGGCKNGECAPLWSLCVDLQTLGDCTVACAMWGGRECVEGGCDGHTILPVSDDAFCSEPPTIAEWPVPDGCAVVPDSPRARCCCSQ